MLGPVDTSIPVFPPEQQAAKLWFAALCERIPPKTQSVGQVRALAYQRGMITLEEMYANAEYLEGDWLAVHEWESGRKLLQQDQPAKTSAKPDLNHATGLYAAFDTVVAINRKRAV